MKRYIIWLVHGLFNTRVWAVSSDSPFTDCNIVIICRAVQSCDCSTIHERQAQIWEMFEK